MARFQNGWLQKKPRKSGDIWVFCYRRQRPEDGRWVQSTPIKVGKVKEYPSEEAAWRRVEELHLNPNQSPFELGAQPLFGELAAHYIQREWPEDQTQATIEKAYSTIRKYKRYLSRWALPRWGTTPALALHPPDVGSKGRVSLFSAAKWKPQTVCRSTRSRSRRSVGVIGKDA